MSINDIFIRVVICICVFITGVIFSISVYEHTVSDWTNISGIFVGLYCYSAYILLGMAWSRSVGFKRSIVRKTAA